MGEPSTGNQPGQDEQKTPNIADDTKNEAPTPDPSVSTIPTKVDFPPSKNDQNHGCKKYKYFKAEFKFWVEVIAIFAAIFLAAITYFQWKEMRQTRIMDERAWVLPYDLGAVTNDSKTSFKILVKNTGKTPALNVRLSSRWCSGLDQIPERDEKFAGGLHDSDHYSGTYAPGAVGYILTEPFDETAIQKLKNGATLYIYGTIWYDDIFGNHHWSQYCFQVEPNFTFAPINIHNSCDDAEADKKN